MHKQTQVQAAFLLKQAESLSELKDRLYDIPGRGRLPNALQMFEDAQRLSQPTEGILERHKLTKPNLDRAIGRILSAGLEDDEVLRDAIPSRANLGASTGGGGLLGALLGLAVKKPGLGGGVGAGLGLGLGTAHNVKAEKTRRAVNLLGDMGVFHPKMLQRVDPLLRGPFRGEA